MKVDYVILQDKTTEVLRASSWEECIEYLRNVKEEYDPYYMIRYNERDGTLAIQDINTGEFLTTLKIRIDDFHGSLFNPNTVLT